MSNVTNNSYYDANGYSYTPAAPKTKKKLTNIEAIFRTIKKAGAKGLTCAQVEARLKLSHGTASGRIVDLERYGDIVFSGTMRQTKSGRKALVWVAKK